MARRIKTTLSQKRQAELRRQYRRGQDVGRAFIKYFVEEMRQNSGEDITPTLTAEELNFLQTTVEKDGDKREEFITYYTYYKIIAGIQHWIDYYNHMYYRGFFNALSMLQSALPNLKNLCLLVSLSSQNNEEIKEAKELHTADFEVIDIALISTMREFMEPSLKNLHIYAIMIKAIEDEHSLGITPLIPDMKYHENEILGMQELIRALKNNIESACEDNLIDEAPNTLKILDEFCAITPKDFLPSEEEKEFYQNRAIEIMQYNIDMIYGISFNTDKDTFRV